MIRDGNEIRVDIDRDRIREISEEAFRMIFEYLDAQFYCKKEDLIDKVGNILDNERIATTFFIPVGNSKIPDLVLRVNPLKREVLCKSAFKKKVAKLNHFIRILNT